VLSIYEHCQESWVSLTWRVLAGSEFLTAVVMKSSSFGDIKPCSLLEADCRRDVFS
jgi:hypothetical protein